MMHVSVGPAASFPEGIEWEVKNHSNLPVIPCDVFLPL